MKYLVICTSGKWQMPIIRMAKSLGFVCIAVDENRDAVGFKVADFFIQSNLTNTKYIVDEILKITENISGAISFCSDAGIGLAQYLNRKFDCSPSLYFNVENATNKAAQRNLWKDTEVPQPKFEVFGDMDEALSYANSITLPFVVKPTDSSGSRGVAIVTKKSELKKAVASAFAFSKSGEIIFEDFMPGTEFTVEVFAIDHEVHVLLVTRKTKISEATRTVSRELRSIPPAHPLYLPIANLAKKAFFALGLNNGPGHLEMIVDEENGPVGIVEAAFRGGGFNLADRLVQVTTGFDLTRASLSSFANESVKLGQIGYVPSVLFFQPTRAGRLVEITGLEKVNGIQGVEIEILGIPGTVYEGASTDGDRLCTIIISATTESELEEKMKLVENLLEFKFEQV